MRRHLKIWLEFNKQTLEQHSRQTFVDAQALAQQHSEGPKGPSVYDQWLQSSLSSLSASLPTQATVVAVILFSKVL